MAGQWPGLNSKPEAERVDLVRRILSAPGSVVAVVDARVWALTAYLRAQLGPIFLFDPQCLTGQSQTWWWNPMAPIQGAGTAARVAAHFLRETGTATTETAGARNPRLSSTVTAAVRHLFLAAAQVDGSLRDIRQWVQSASLEPAALLDRAGYHIQATSLRTALNQSHPLLAHVLKGIRAATGCLGHEAVMRWVTPPATWAEPPDNLGDVVELPLWNLVTRPGDPQPTVYLLCAEDAARADPVVAAFAGGLIDIATTAAAVYGGRLDPPITIARLRR